jgi:hypothetical protein
MKNMSKEGQGKENEKEIWGDFPGGLRKYLMVKYHEK